MHSDPQSSHSSEGHQDQSADFSYIESSPSPKYLSQVPLSSSATPQRQSSSYEATSLKRKKNKNKKNTKTKPKIKQKKQQKALTFEKFRLSPQQAIYLTKNEFPKRYSLQDVDKVEKESPLKMKGFAIVPNKFLQSESINLSGQDLTDPNSTFSEGYYFIESFINEMLQEKQVPQFFKKEIKQVIRYESARKYYANYKKIIKYPLSFNTLMKMIRKGIIKNYLEFKIKFDQMLINSRYYHTLKGNLRMINSGDFLKRRLQEKYFRELNPQANFYEEDLIKTLDKKVPKIIDLKLENEEEKTATHMDLTDEHNKYRFTVMNDFLRIACLRNQQRLQIIIGNLQSVISRYPESKVELIRNEEDKQDQNQKKRLFSRISQKTGLQSVSRSPHSSISEIISEPQTIYYRIVPNRIEVDLFQHMKKFIIREVQQKKESLMFGENMLQEPQRMMYPHQDSDDFDLDDDSNDS